MKGKDSLKDAIYNAILESIISQEYRPNQVLNEKTLVEKYGCSKSPVREALVSLCNDNVLRNIPRYGYEVVRLTVEDIQEMLQFRLVLEGGLLSANCEKFGAAQLDCLEQIDQACRSATDDIWSHWAFNTEFHLRMTAFAATTMRWISCSGVWTGSSGPTRNSIGASLRPPWHSTRKITAPSCTRSRRRTWTPSCSI